MNCPGDDCDAEVIEGFSWCEICGEPWDLIEAEATNDPGQYPPPELWNNETNEAQWVRTGP